MPLLTTTFEDWTIRMQAPESKPVRVMVMLHGWTGDEESMWFFTRDLVSNYWLLAPRAPYPGKPSGFSWRPMTSLTSFPPSYEQMRPSAAMLEDLIERWGIANAVDVRQVDMMGFSQGAAMTLTYALTYPERLRKFAVLAGFTPIESSHLLISQPLKGKSVFVAHGTVDEMVPIEMARETKSNLETAGAQVVYCEAKIGHKVSSECLTALGKFFSS
jgi:phospholipase/carboxylesterase